MDGGAMIPDVTVLDGDGTPVLLSGLIGRACVIYFYPRDATAGCTREAQDFSARVEAFAAAETSVIGVSRDTPASHARFAARHALTIRLLSDPDGVACAAFGVWVEKTMYGRAHMGIERATFLFDAQGRLAQGWRKVRVPGHAASVLDAARALAATT